MSEINGNVVESRSKLWDQDLFQAPGSGSNKKRVRTVSEGSRHSDEDDVSKLMREMGLPTSFKTTKKFRRHDRTVDLHDSTELVYKELVGDESEYAAVHPEKLEIPTELTVTDHETEPVQEKQEEADIAELCEQEALCDTSDNLSITALESNDWKLVECKTKKNRKKRRKPKKPNQMRKNSVGQVLDKYWCQRYRLFSMFDQGIILDDESWYSVTPERIACHIANRISRYEDDDWTPLIIIEGFCGAGGNTIQFAQLSDHVIAIDIDPKKIEMAKHNAGVYGVEKRIDFIVGDYLQVIKSLKRVVDLFQPVIQSQETESGGDAVGAGNAGVRVAVFMSPPWGGPNYLVKDKFDLHDMTPDGMEIIQATREHLTSNIAILLPRNVDQDQMIASAGEGQKIEIEKNVLNGKVKTITAYYGELIMTSEEDH